MTTGVAEGNAVTTTRRTLRVTLLTTLKKMKVKKLNEQLQLIIYHVVYNLN